MSHMYHFWLVFCSFVLSRKLLSNLFCLSSSISAQHHLQVWNYKPWPSLPRLVKALVSLQKFPIEFRICQWKCPVQNENGLALSKMKFQACVCALCILCTRLILVVPRGSQYSLAYRTQVLITELSKCTFKVTFSSLGRTFNYNCFPSPTRVTIWLLELLHPKEMLKECFCPLTEQE